MFAAASYMLFIALNGAAAAQPKDAAAIEARTSAVAQLVAQARRDFEVKYAELGLLGAAPLVGKEAPANATTERAPARADEAGAAQAQPRNAGRRHAQRRIWLKR